MRRCRNSEFRLIRVNVLLVCSRNQWRSPTAEQVWRKLPGIQVRSAGTSPKARRSLRAYEYMDSELVEIFQTLAAEFYDAKST
jgi:predicted protein tyrosine phosphatase